MCCLAAVVSLLPASVHAAPVAAPVPTGARYSAERGGDPLQDPVWYEHERALRITTGVFAGLSAATLVPSVLIPLARPYDGCDGGDCKFNTPMSRRDHMYDEALIGLGVAAGLSMLGLVISGGMYDRHLDRAVLYRPTPDASPLADLRADPDWYARDRRLTRGMRVTAALAGISGGVGWICWGILEGDGPGLYGAALGLSLFSGVNLVAFGAQAVVRRKHRRKLATWPQLGAGGLTFQF